MPAPIEESSFHFRDCFFQVLLFNERGDELALHSHSFEHLTLVLEGRAEAFAANGTYKVEMGVGAPPVAFPLEVLHGIRCLEAPLRVLQISPRQPG